MKRLMNRWWSPKAQTGSEVCTRDGGGYQKSHQTPLHKHQDGWQSWIRVGFWNFSNTRNWRFFDFETFQIPRPNGSLILSIFKYSEPTVLLILNFSNTQTQRFFWFWNFSNTQTQRFFWFWNFSNTQTQRFFWFWNFLNTQTQRFFWFWNFSNNWNQRVLKDQIPAHTGLYQGWVGIGWVLIPASTSILIYIWYIYISSPGIKLVLPQVPTKHVLVQGGYFLMSYQFGQSFDAKTCTRVPAWYLEPDPEIRRVLCEVTLSLGP